MNDQKARRCACGAPLDGKSNKCAACRKAAATEKRKKWKENHMGYVTCDICGQPFITVIYPAGSSRKTATHCSKCRTLIGAARRKAAREAAEQKAGTGRFIRLAAAEGPRRRPIGPEPKGDKNSLEHVVWELQKLNAARREKGEYPLSYGAYVAIRDKG